MNIIEIQDSLKDLPDNALMQEMQMPTGSAPQFLVLSELKRRKRMRDEYQRRQNADMKTVAEEAISAAGMPQEGIMQMSQAMNPNSSIAQNTGMDTAMPMEPTQAPQPEQPMMMADGGVVRMFEGGMSGGTISAIANLKVNYPDVYEAAVEEGIVEQVAEYMQARAADAPYALDALEDPAPFFMKRPSQRSVDKKQLEIEESQPERALQARIDSRTALSRYGDDDPIFGTSALEQRERPVTGEYTVARDTPVTSIEGQLTPPPSDPLGSVPDGRDFGDKTPSRSISPLIPSVADAGFGTQIENLREQERQDNIYKFLADPSESDAIADALDRGVHEDYKRRIRSGEENLATQTGLFFPTGSSSDAVAAKDVNLRALQFLQGDQFTPPSEIYSDLLGGDPRAIAKYQGESPQVIDEISDRLYREAQQGELAKAAQTYGDYDAEAQAKRDAVSRMLEINQVPEPDNRGILEKAITNVITGGDEEEVSKGKAITKDDLSFGKLTENAADAQGDLSLGELISQDTSTAPAGKKSTTTSGGTGGTGGGVGGRIAQMLADREKSAEADKWLSLAQAGMALMASESPTFGGALGEAGLVGIGAMQKARKQYDADIMDLLTLQQRANAASSRRSGGLTASNMISLMDDLRDYKGDIQDRINDLNDLSKIGTMSDEERTAQLQRLQAELMRTDIELGTYRNALRGGGTGGSSFDVRGGSTQQPSVGYSLGTASQ